jgi:hypothetical protein
MRPFSWVEGSSSQAVILIFDISASMAATDLSSYNRLETAKEQARLLLSNLSQDANFTIIAAGADTHVLVSTSQDRRLLYQALDSLRPRPTGSDLTSALELASAIAARQPDAEIVIYSDGGANLPERLAIHGQIRYIPIGESGNNQSISQITLEPGNSQRVLTAFIQVANYSTEPAQRRLTLSADGELVDAHDLQIPAHGQISIISENIPNETEVLEAVLTESDALSLDDRAWTLQQVSESSKVVLISQGNRFLETALGLLPGIKSSTLNQEDFGREMKEDASLLIIDNYGPSTSTLQSSNLLYLGPISSTNTFSVTGIVENPIPRPVSDDDPLLEFVDLIGVSILDASRIPLPDWSRPVLIDENSGYPLLFAGEIDGRRVAVMAFDPRRSDLPLQAAYPILIANLTEWLLPGRIGDIPEQVSPGGVLTFTPQPEIVDLTVIRPDGTDTRLKIQDGRAIYADTTQLGVYRVNWGEDKSLTFAVNFSNPQESDILPIENLSLLDGASATGEHQPQQTRREWWRLLVGIALIILVIEWMVYNRATLTKLGYQVKRNLKHLS